MDDLAIKEFEATLIRDINAVVLPLEVKRLVLLELYNTVVDATNNAVQQQTKAREEQARVESTMPEPEVLPA